MKYIVIFLLFISLQSAAQTIIREGRLSENEGFDVLPGFINPPKGYGEVPFYWWQGDTLTKERILWQLDQLANKNISSLQINYSHRDSGGLTYGLIQSKQASVIFRSMVGSFQMVFCRSRKA